MTSLKFTELPNIKIHASRGFGARDPLADLVTKDALPVFLQSLFRLVVLIYHVTQSLRQ